MNKLLQIINYKLISKGDSGGPLAHNATGKAVLIGIVSWGIVPCGTVGAPSVYTKTSSFLTWIGNIMARN